MYWVWNVFDLLEVWISCEGRYLSRSNACRQKYKHKLRANDWRRSSAHSSAMLPWSQANSGVSKLSRSRQSSNAPDQVKWTPGSERPDLWCLEITSKESRLGNQLLGITSWERLLGNHYVGRLRWSCAVTELCDTERFLCSQRIVITWFDEKRKPLKQGEAWC